MVFYFLRVPRRRRRRRVPGGHDLVPGGEERARGRAGDELVLDRHRGAGRGARNRCRRVRRQRGQRQPAQVRVVARERVPAIGGQLAERGRELRGTKVAPAGQLLQRRRLLRDAPLGAVDRAALVGVERREQRARELEPDAVCRAFRAVEGAQPRRELRQRRVEHLVPVRAGALGSRDRRRRRRRRRRRGPHRGAGGGHARTGVTGNFERAERGARRRRILAKQHPSLVLLLRVAVGVPRAVSVQIAMIAVAPSCCNYSCGGRERERDDPV